MGARPHGRPARVTRDLRYSRSLHPHRPRGRHTASASRALEDRLLRPQLSRARRRAGQRSSRRAAALLQATLVAACARGGHPSARAILARRFRRRARQERDGQWTRAKGFDTFCPCGPFVSTEVNPAAGVFVETKLNGERKQHGFTRDFIFSVPHLLVYITAAMTLEPGDLIPTGTPAGVGPMSSGDTVEVTIEGLGVLRNSVEAGK